MRKALFIVLLSITACRHDIQSVEVDSSAIFPSELNAHPSQYDGKRVMVYGLIVNESENHGIWDSQVEQKANSAKHCVSVLYPKSIEANLNRMNRKHVIVTGIFMKDITNPNEIFLGLCNKSAIMVDADTTIQTIK